MVKAQEDYRKAEDSVATPGAPPHRHAADQAPDPSDGDPPAPQDDDWRRAHRQEHLAGYRVKEQAVLQRWAAVLHSAVEHLLTHGEVTVVLDTRTIEARILRFWRGNTLLVTRSHGPRGGGQSLTRINRDPRAEPPEVILGYLTRAATKG